MNHEARYSISVAAEITGLHPQTLRMYESRGLVRPRRTTGGTRRFSDADIARLAKITALTVGVGHEPRRRRPGARARGHGRGAQPAGGAARERRCSSPPSDCNTNSPRCTAHTGATWCSINDHNTRSYGLSKTDNQIAGGILRRTGHRAGTRQPRDHPRPSAGGAARSGRRAWPAACWRRRAIRPTAVRAAADERVSRAAAGGGRQRHPAGLTGAARHARGGVHRGRDAQGRVRGRGASAAGAGQAARSSIAAPS